MRTLCSRNPCLIIALIALCGVVLTLSPEARGATSPESSRFGAQQITVQTPLDESIFAPEWVEKQERIMKELTSIGIGWGRWLGRWDALRGEREKPSGYDFRTSDLAAEAAYRSGLALVAHLCNASGFNALGYEPLKDRDAFMKYVQATVERYDGDSDFGLPEGDPAYPKCDLNGDGKISEEEKAEWGKTHRFHCWQIIKEPVPPYSSSAKGPLFTGIEASEVVKILEAGWTAVRRADPNGPVLFAAPPPVPAGGMDNLKQYLREILEAGGGKYFDVIGVDCFTHPPEEVIETHRSILQSFGLKKTIWVIQTGSPGVAVTPQYIPYGGTLAKQAAFVVTGFVQSFAAGAEKVFWGDFLYDIDEVDGQYWHNWGLLNFDAVRKRPGFHTYALMISKLDKFSAARKLAEGQYRFEFSNKAPVFVLWSESGEKTVDLSGELGGSEALITHIITEMGQTTPRTERLPSAAIPVSELPIFVEPIKAGSASNVRVPQ